MLLRNLALASSLAIAAAPAAAYAAPQTSTVVERSSTKVVAPSTDAQSYAEREQQDTQVAEFQGGDMIIIGVSGGALIVLLFLLLILV